MVRPTVYGGSQARDWIWANAAVMSDPFNPLYQAGDQTFTSVVTQSAAVGFLTHHTTAGTPFQKIFLFLDCQTFQNQVEPLYSSQRKYTHTHSLACKFSSRAPEFLAEMPRKPWRQSQELWCRMLECQEREPWRGQPQEGGHEWRWTKKLICFAKLASASLVMKSPEVKKSVIIYASKSLLLNVVIISV